MIPHRLHHIWTGPPMPDHLAAYRATWRSLMPEWEHTLWTDDDDWTWLQNYDLWARAADLFPRNVGQFRADVARLELLHRHGGVYADCDLELVAPLDPYVQHTECFAAWEHDDVWVNNAIMGAVPSHPFLAALIDELPRSVERAKAGARPNVVSGPQFLTPVYRQQPAGSVTVYPSRWFYPYLWSELDRQGEHFPHAVTVHHWHNRRTNR